MKTFSVFLFFFTWVVVTGSSIKSTRNGTSGAGGGGHLIGHDAEGVEAAEAAVASVLRCTPLSKSFQTSIYLLLEVNGTPPEELAETWMLNVLASDVSLVEDLIVEKYNALASHFCDPHHCRLTSANAEKENQQLLYRPGNRTSVDDASVAIRVRFNIFGFCDSLDILKMDGAIIFHNSSSMIWTPGHTGHGTEQGITDTFEGGPESAVSGRRGPGDHKLRLPVPKVVRTKGFNGHCPCLTTFPERRAPFEKNLIEALDEAPAVKRNGSSPTGSQSNMTNIASFLYVAESSTQFACSADVSTFETTIMVRLSGHSAHAPPGEMRLLESSLAATYNELNFWGCDSPYYRSIENVTSTGVSLEQGLGGFTNLFTFQVLVSCRNCSDVDLLLFTENVDGYEQLSDSLKFPYLPLPVSLASQNGPTNRGCFCQANIDFGESVRSPFVSEFVRAFNETLSGLWKVHLFQNGSHLENVAEVKPGASLAPTTSPTVQPSLRPTRQPTIEPTFEPTDNPTSKPTSEPTETTFEPSFRPTPRPTSEPIEITFEPTFEPSFRPTPRPTREPTEMPFEPTPEPSFRLTPIPTDDQTGLTPFPTPRSPLSNPLSPRPTVFPTPEPSFRRTPIPTLEPFVDDDLIASSPFPTEQSPVGIPMDATPNPAPTQGRRELHKDLQSYIIYLWRPRQTDAPIIEDDDFPNERSHWGAPEPLVSAFPTEEPFFDDDLIASDPLLTERFSVGIPIGAPTQGRRELHNEQESYTVYLWRILAKLWSVMFGDTVEIEREQLPDSSAFNHDIDLENI